MSIWFQPVQLADLSHHQKDNALESLGIQLTEIGDNFLVGTMPVDNRTKQTYGVLHGGSSVLLAESLGSIASNLVVDSSVYACVGQEINANHIRPVRTGVVTGVAVPVHIGRGSHIWTIKITNEDDKLVCFSRLTVAVIEKRS